MCIQNNTVGSFKNNESRGRGKDDMCRALFSPHYDVFRKTEYAKEKELRNMPQKKQPDVGCAFRGKGSIRGR